VLAYYYTPVRHIARFQIPGIDLQGKTALAQVVSGPFSRACWTNLKSVLRLSAQPTEILGTKLKLSRQRALGLGF
jgi:hypothetical protein